MASNNSWGDMLSVRHLLTAIATVASLTFGMFVWDAERALTKLDRVDQSSATVAGQVQVIADQVKRLDTTQSQQAGELTDHEKRITVLETKTADLHLRGGEN